MKSPRRYWVPFVPVCAALALGAFAEQLPIHAYGFTDGLPSNAVNSILSDSQGFLWFATREGLARFDGYEFDTYNRALGFPTDAITQLLELRSGDYLAATPEGLVSFHPLAPAAAKVSVYRPPLESARRIYVLYEDHQGEIWCGTEDGLYRLRTPRAQSNSWQFEPISLQPKAGKKPADHRVISLFEDSRGNLWIGTINALYRRQAGRISEYQPHTSLFSVVLEDRDNRLWAGTATGLWRIGTDAREEYRFIPALVPKETLIVFSMIKAPTGGLWLGTSAGLIRWTCGNDGVTGRAQKYTELNGLAHRDITALELDREGNLWLGSDGGGAMRIAHSGFLTYLHRDHLSFPGNVWPTLFRDRRGDVHVAFRHVLNFRRGERFVEVKPAIPNPKADNSWGWHQTVLQDHAREWWIATSNGAVRFPDVPVERLDRTRPKAVYTTRNGLRTDNIFRLFEDQRGGIWIASIGLEGVNGLSRWDRRTNSFQHFKEHTYTAATAFAEAADGTVWIGYWDGTLGRFRNGSFTFYTTGDGLAGGGIQALHIDHAQRLWIASLRGLTRVDAPAADHPSFNRFGSEQGLSSNVIFCVAEDGWGRVYLATGRGIDRVAPDGRIVAGRVPHYSEADGIARGELRDILVDAHGVLWVATKQGISRLQLDRELPRPPPPVFIRQLRVRGLPYAFWDRGPKIPLLTFGPNQNQLEFAYAGLTLAPGEVLSYEYKLEPAEHDWSAPSQQRSVTYSNVAPGHYRFSVRLITADDIIQNHPASMELVILAPVWHRVWFRTLIACFTLFLIYLAHRYRAGRLLELERIRTRIATDLHDDIGSGLSQISILTEVAMRNMNGIDPVSKTALANISSVSRELAESMSDIVWSLNSRRDTFSDLLQRMRRFTSDMLAGRDIAFLFEVSGFEYDIRIPPDIRRELYLVFKEALHNLLRHSGCTEARIAISIDSRWLNLVIEDNGRGFAPARSNSGNGMQSMRERVSRIGGTIDFDPGTDGGVRLRVGAPLRPTRLRSHRTT